MYLTENNYVNRFEKCLECGNDNKLYLNKKLYICKNYKCRKSYSPLRGTIFIKMKLPLNKQLQIENYLLLKMPCSSVASYLQLSKNTVTAYHRLFRKYMDDKIYPSGNRKIGGRNKVVEIDKTKISKRKYNKGHRVEGAWVIGGIERSNLKNKIKMKIKSYS